MIYRSRQTNFIWSFSPESSIGDGGAQPLWKSDGIQKSQLSILLSKLWKLFGKIIWWNCLMKSFDGIVWWNIKALEYGRRETIWAYIIFLRKTGSWWCDSTGTFPVEVSHSIALVLRSYDSLMIFSTNQ